MERERQLGAMNIIEKFPKMLADHPGDELNKKTNGSLTKKRVKVQNR